MPVIPTTNLFFNLKTMIMKKEPTHRCSKCGQMKYKFEFHQGCTICRECRHKTYLKHRQHIIRRTERNLKKRLMMDAKFREEYALRKNMFLYERYYKKTTMELQLFMFNINYVL